MSGASRSGSNDVDLSLAVALSDLARQTQVARLVLEVARVGAWSWNPATDQVRWSPELESLLGLDPGSFEGTFDAFMKRVHPDDRHATEASVRQAVDEGRDFTIEHRVMMPDGAIRWLEGRGIPLVEPSGDMNEWAGVGIDITERREAELEREELLRTTLRAKARAEQANHALRRALDRLDALLQRKEEVAETLQQAVLPQEMPEVDGITICATYLAGTTEDSVVGGDWYDLSVNQDGNPCLVIGDVAGHGLTAAVAMARLRFAFQLCAQEGNSPGDLLARINRFIDGGDRWEMATACAVTIDLADSSLTFSRAGHPPPLVWNPQGSAEYLTESGGPPLGVAPSHTFRETCHSGIRSGSIVILYTDGLIERRGENIDVGLERLREAVLAEAPHAEMSELCDALVKRLFSDLTPRDDVAVLAVRVD